MIIDYETNPLDIMIRRGEWHTDLCYFHWHDKLEIIQCLGDGLGALIDGERYEVKKGDLIVIGEQIIHNFCIYDDNTSYRLLQFPLSILLNNGVIPHPVKPVITKAEIDEDGKTAVFVDNILEILESEGNVAAGEKNPISENLCSALYFLLMNRFSEKDDVRVRKREKTEFYNLLKYVNENYSRDITVSSIAETFFMDRGRLSKLFLKYSGIKLNAYINALRLSKALSLLERGESVSRAALDSGFQSVRTFNEVYKKAKETRENK